MYQLLFIALVFLTGCDNSLVLGNEDVNVSEKKLFASAQALDKSHDFEQAAEQYENFVGLFPFSPKKALAELRVMKIYDYLGHYEDLEAFSEELVQSSSPTPESLYYFARANFKLSRSEFFDLISKDLGGSDLIRLEKSKQAYEEVIRHKGSSLALKNSAKKEHAEVCEMIAKNHYKIGQFYLKNGHEKAANLRFEQIKNLYPSTNVARTLVQNQKNLTAGIG